MPPQAATAPARPSMLTPMPMPPCKIGTGRDFFPKGHCHIRLVSSSTARPPLIQLLKNLPQGTDLMEHPGHLTRP